MQMKIPHSLVVLVVSLGIFATASPTGNFAPGGCTERIEVPVEVVKTCPQPEIISIKTVYRTVKEIVPDCGCTDDFTDFANVQLIADTACRNGLIFSPDGKTKKRGIFERSPACQSFSIVEDPSIALKKRYEGGDCQDGCGSGDLTGHIHDKFDQVKSTFKHNLNQNINNNDNTDLDDSQVTGGGGDGFGGFGGFGGFKSKRQFGFGGFGGGFGGFGGGDFDDNDNQNINQNVNANQNLMANLGKFNSFFGTGNEGAIGSGGAATAAAAGLRGLAFGINDNTDFNVNNNVAFEDDTFFKKAKRNAQFGFGGDFGDGAFDDNDNQNINQNINNNQNLNEDFFNGVFGGGGDGFGFDGIGIVPFFPGFIGGFGGFGGFDDFGGFEDSAMNENFNFVPDTTIETFGSGSGLNKRCDSGNCVSGNTNVNYNSNINYNTNDEAVAVPQFETIIETVPVVETIPVVETVYQPVVEYETVEIIEKVPVVEQVYEPVTVVEQVAVPACTTYECPQANKKTVSTVTEVFESVPQPVVEKVEVVEVAQPVVEVVEVAQPVVEVVEVAQPVVEVVEVAQPIVEVVEIAKPVVEYSVVFYPVAGCGVPNRPSYTYGSCNK